ncbi:MAG TPA: outer membrane beta-barrel protein [Nitrospiraceae bacterium]|nr:outer membrane beta-barrel protein [Nitrospiraceae bacterium]
MARWRLGGLITGLFLLGFSTVASADSYVAIGGGLNFAELDSTDAGTISLKQNGFFGAKFGHYFDDRQFNWLGFEVDLYRAAPSIKQQTVNGSTNQALGGSTGNIPGADFLVHSLAFNALIRFTGYQYKVEPYTGLGIGLNLGNISEGSFVPEASFAPSFNVLAGTRYYITPKIAPFIEYKYNFAEFSFSRNNLTASYRAHLIMFGISFHFGR